MQTFLQNLGHSPQYGLERLARLHGEKVPTALRTLLDRQDWPTLIERVTAFANGQVRAKTWLRQRGGIPPLAKEGGDYALDAIRKVYESEETGTRGPKDVSAMDTEKLFRHLCGIVRSDISTDTDRPENKFTIRPKDGDDWEKESESALLQLMTDFKDEPETIRVIEMLMDGSSDVEVKKELGMTRGDLTRMKQRLADSITGAAAPSA